jgi:hypothetical protein
LIREHLAFCSACALLCEELAAMVDSCKEFETSLPPNPRAMWRRINNIIESERATAPAPPVSAERRRFWRLTMPQLASAVLCIAVVSSLVTIVVIRNYSVPADADLVTRSTTTQSPFEKLLGKVGLSDTPQEAREKRLRELHAAISYWDARVEARRQQWDRPTREAFDRNLQVIDESVNDYTITLERDPDDEISGEMLDSVLDDKMKLLRDFSDL